MKKITVSILIALMCKFSTGQKLVGNYYDYGKIHPHEQYYVNSVGQKSGLYKEYNEDGVVIKECNYLNGLENGLCSEYKAIAGNQRVLVKKANFKNGQSDGPFVWYCQYTDFKTKVSEGLFKNAKRTGVWKFWNCTDNPAKGSGLTSVGSFVEDKEEGLWTEYYDNGKVSATGKYSNGKTTGEWRYYTAQGTLDRRGSFEEGILTGTWSYYDPADSTKPIFTGTYSHGNRVGEWVSYFDKDWNETHDKSKYAFYQKITYDNGIPVNGLVSTYYITGEKQSVCHMVRVGSYWDKDEEVKLQKTGLYSSYFKNGKVEMEGNYSEQGKTDGHWKVYYESGALNMEGDYGNGSMKEDWKEYYESGKVKSIMSYNMMGQKYRTKNFDEQGNETPGN